MTIEREFISKTYYQTLIDENKKEHPIQVLGERYMDEKQKEMPDFSSIRFAQGEVYFLNNDYEAAIFKWENILDENLKPWAQKNIADAHFEMDLLKSAEKFYKAVETDSVALKTEVLLQLFTLYIKQDKHEKAVDSIKKAVDLNPDYAGVTEIARSFFEEKQDWDNAIELAVNEASRTKSLSWFTVLEGYVEQGLTIKMEPTYFTDALIALFEIDKFQFENLTTALWKCYKQSDFYFQWLREINHFLLNNNLYSSYTWKELPNLFKETYFELISGKFLIRDFSDLIPNHLTNWMNISTRSDTLICSSAILAWNETFQGQLDASMVSEAENLLNSSSGSVNGSHEVMQLLESINKWAEGEGLQDVLSTYIKPMMEENNTDVEATSKILFIVKKAIEFLIAKRVEVENAIIEKIQWNEEIYGKLNGIHHLLRDMEEEKSRDIEYSFSKIRMQFEQNMMVKIPELLRKCSNLVKENSDFGKLHIELNEEMNKRITTYLEEEALLDIKNAMQGWITDCESKFMDAQTYLDEMSEGFNKLYGEDNIALNCDFKVLDDWRRDVDRITRGIVPIEKANIMLRYTPSQMLLKSAGKLLGSISKNKEKLHNKYKNFVESTDYNQVVHSIITPFLRQLELFERSISRDVSMFFSSSFVVLDKTREDAQVAIDKNKESLMFMRKNPEIYHDPLRLFELKHRQYELMNTLEEFNPEYINL